MKKIIKILEIIIIAILMIIQPVLDIYILNSGVFEIFGFNITTIVRFTLVGILFLLMLLNIKNIRFKKTFFIYCICVAIYSIIHIITITNFVSLVPGNFNYSFIEEIFYIIRMFLPVFLIYVVLNSNIKQKHILIGSYICCFIICAVLMISNITKTSLCSYNDMTIRGNIVDWFINKGEFGYLFLASRGFFNTIIIVYLLLLFAPIAYAEFYKKEKFDFISAIIIVCIMFSCFIAGTKSTSYGFLIIAIIMPILFIFFTFIKKEFGFKLKNVIFSLLILLLSVVILQFAPTTSRQTSDQNFKDKVSEKIEQNQEEEKVDTDFREELQKDEEISDAIKEEVLEDIDENETINNTLDKVEKEEDKRKVLASYLKLYYRGYGFNLHFIEDSYPYQYDPFFWKELADTMLPYERINNRVIVQKIYDRIYEINNKKYDEFIGIGYSRTSKVFNLERDFLYQYYSIGIIGVILLLGPYVLIVFLGGLYILRYFRTKLTINNCSIMLGIGLTLCLAYYSGNTLENLGISIPLGIMCGYLIKELSEDKKE